MSFMENDKLLNKWRANRKGSAKGGMLAALENIFLGPDPMQVPVADRLLAFRIEGASEGPVKCRPWEIGQ